MRNERTSIVVHSKEPDESIIIRTLPSHASPFCELDTYSALSRLRLRRGGGTGEEGTGEESGGGGSFDIDVYYNDLIICDMAILL